jgi:hypothetical protein
MDNSGPSREQDLISELYVRARKAERLLQRATYLISKVTVVEGTPEEAEFREFWEETDIQPKRIGATAQRIPRWKREGDPVAGAHTRTGKWCPAPYMREVLNQIDDSNISVRVVVKKGGT